MCEVNCMNCRVAAFKFGLCPNEFCEKHKAIGSEEDFIKTIEPGRKQGKRIKTYRNGFGTLIGYCDKCGRSNAVSNFCPNCGADMR